MQVDGVERALRRADAAADALVRVDDARAAAKAARGLLFDLLFGERDALVAKRPAQRLVIADALARRCVVIDGDQRAFLVELNELAAVAADRQRRVLDKTVQRDRALLARGDGVDGKFLTRISVAADEDILFRRLIRDGVCLDRAVGVELNSGCLLYTSDAADE